ncbi:T9SS type A sorting domain-containing protein [Psychroserpens damuponensis]|uniref:T9SS type A sorting domain-containing protein n=1 Tax=Psychroserpens damuponensis TaxID=943936 RepID=UPI00058D129F|nr:T9SS type A sorting domain-containing protein [Psychroserpens damuponensis]
MISLNRFTDLCSTLKSRPFLILVIFIFCISNSNYAQTIAFPTANGFGKYASGGRGGTVIKVTNLNDSGPGSLRQALMYTSGARTIVFEVGGTITLTSALTVLDGNVTVAGQTAPGDGILIKGSMVLIQTSNVIMRYIRFRPGNSQSNTADGLNITSWGSDIVENIIIDHCSISWADDENFDVRAVSEGKVQNITLQNSIIAESLYGAAAAKNTFNKTYYKNLFIHNTERNIAHGFPTAGMFDSEMINNLVYGVRWASSPSMGSKFTVLNNHYRKSSEVETMGTAVDATFAGSGTLSETYAYISGNITPDGMSEYHSNLNPYIKTTPYLSSGIVAIPADQVANDILSHVGASLPKRDAVDVRLINQYNNGNGVLAYSGTYPTMQSGTVPVDSDNDGMPNNWETQNGLNPNDASDRNFMQPDGYTNLEYYLNGMSIATTSIPDCTNQINSFPYNEDFENTLGDWTQSSLDDTDWTIDANGTPSSSTGPSNAARGSYYVFVEASGNQSNQAILNSPCFDLSNLTNANFSFKYHQYGSSDEGTIDLEVSDDNGAHWTSIWNSSGNLGDTWLTADIDLDAYVGGLVQLRFNRVIGNSYQADIAIDDVSLTNTLSSIGTDCSAEINSFPYNESFENTLGIWTQSSLDDIDWTIHSNGTPSSSTGPSNAAQGSYYVFVEASNNLNKNALLNSPCFDLSALSNATFSFNYHQYGASDAGKIDLEASDDNGVSWSTIWSSSGNLGNVWLAANVDISSYSGGNLQLRFNRNIGSTWQADIAIDNVSITENTSTISSCSGGINSFPYSEGFENTLGDWTQSSLDDIDWTIHSNGTPSSSTGPSSAAQGAYYMFVEASNQNNSQALLNSPCFDLSALSNAIFSFNYHQDGASDMGSIDLEVSNDNGANWISVWNSSGNLGNVWLTANVDISEYLGEAVQLRFNRLVGNTWQADIAIDNVSLSEEGHIIDNGCTGEITSFPYAEGFENSLGAWTQSSFDDVDWLINTNGTPSNGTGPSMASQGSYYAFVEASGNSSNQAILNSPCFDLSSLSSANFSFKYHQFGSSDEGTIDLEASNDNGASWISIWNSSGNLGDTWLTANINLDMYVGGQVKLRFNRIIGNSYLADIAIDDVSLLEVVSNVNPGCSGGISSFPYAEGFENNLGTWTQSSLDDIDWTVNSNGTPSNGTGPSSAYQGTHYIFVEASNNLNKKAILNSPCFDLSGFTNATFSFNYHQYGAPAMGIICLEVSDDAGANWTCIWKSSNNLGDSWQKASVDLSTYAGGNVQLRFNRVIGGIWKADMAIDNISLSSNLATSRESITASKKSVVPTDLDTVKDVSLYPNPVKDGVLHIESTFTNMSYEIYSMVGQLISKGNLKNKTIDVSHLKGAIYQIRFSSEGQTITKRFIKQ